MKLKKQEELLALVESDISAKENLIGKVMQEASVKDVSEDEEPVPECNIPK